MSGFGNAHWPVETASARDIAAISGLLASGMPDPWTDDMVAESLEAGSKMLIVRGESLGSAAAIAGCAHLRILEDEAEVLHLAVAPDCRRRGLGGFLLRRAMGECARRGVKSVFLEVRAGNVAARALYSRSGFVDVGVRARYYRDGEDARVMRLALAFPLPSG